MNQSAILVLIIVLSSVLVASGTDICHNAPCEPQINVSLGMDLTISVESNPSTVFEWWTKFDPNYLSLMNSTFIGGREIFTFNAKSTGNIEVIMLLLQHWENGTIAKRKIFPINIIFGAVAPRQAIVLGSGINADHTIIKKSSFRSSGDLGTSTISRGQPIKTTYGISSNYYLNESEMETPSKAVSRHDPVGYDLNPPENPSL